MPTTPVLGTPVLGSPVLVTGGSGFIAGHVILHLLAEGYTVRTTVRSLEREAAVRAVLKDAGMTRGDALAFVAADLLGDDGWAEAVDGVESVLHVASPVQPGHVDDEQSLILPAREGALRVLRAARDAGVRRVVLTSAFHAAGFGHGRIDHTFTESDWSVLDGPGMDAYGRSKTLAERAAWDFAATESRSLELTTILPVAVMGPVMGAEITGSNHIVQNIVGGRMPAYPDIAIPVVDVRDVARAHLLAMTTPAAAGERFIVSTGAALPLAVIGGILRDGLDETAGAKVPTETIPNDVVEAGAATNPQFAALLPDLGYVKQISTEKTRRMLGLETRDPSEAIVAAATSMIAKGLV